MGSSRSSLRPVRLNRFESSTNTQGAARVAPFEPSAINRVAARLDPFAFPSDTTMRFLLLILSILATSLFIFKSLYIQIQPQEFAAGVRCELGVLARYTQKGVMSYVAGVQEAQMSADGSCLIVYHKDVTLYMLGGVALIVGVAVLIYWLLPFWNLWQQKLVPLDVKDASTLLPYLADLCSEAGLIRFPVFVWNPLSRSTSGLAFGRVGRYYIALSGGLVTLFGSDRASFRAIILHELAHLRNADVSRTYFAIASFCSFILIAVLPFAIISVVSASYSGASLSLFNGVVHIFILVVFVFLTLTATLRVREFYADVRAATWDNQVAALVRVLSRLKLGRRGWLRFAYFHPDPTERCRVLQETERLFHISLWEALGVGIALGLAIPNILMLEDTLLHLLPHFESLDAIDVEAWVTALLLAPTIVVTTGLNVWRTTLIALIHGRGPQRVGRAGLCIGLGLLIGMALSLSNTMLYSGIHNLLLFAISLPWCLVFLLFLRWLVAGTAVWLDVILSRRASIVFYTISLLIVSGVLMVLFMQFIIFQQFFGAFDPDTSTTLENQLSGFVSAIAFFPMYGIYVSVLPSPFFLGAFVCLWAFPFAGWLWYRLYPVPGSNDTLFNVSYRHLILPGRNPLRLRFGLIYAVVSGIVYCILFYIIHTRVHAYDDAGKIQLVNEVILLSILLQAITAGIVAARVRQLSVLHSLFAAFVAGCIMSASMLSMNVLFFRGGATPSFIWYIFSSMTNGGMLPALCSALVVSMLPPLARWVSQCKRKPVPGLVAAQGQVP